MTNSVAKPSTQLVALRDPRSPAAEAYRALRTNIQFSSLDKPIHTLLATSTAPDEGKTTTIANLAVTMAQAEQRVVLVDCDLRRPSLHTVFDRSEEHTSELQSRQYLVCRLLLEKKKKIHI